MTETPKCTSWLGHKFEARYSLVTPPGVTEMIAEINGKSGSYPATTSVKVKYDRHYQCDICVRCGHSVEAKTPEKSTISTT